MRTVNKLRKKGLMDPRPGSRFLPPAGFKILSRRMMQMVPENPQSGFGTYIFGWTFLVLLWNVMSRPEALELVQLSHITWLGDCLGVDEYGGKGDQKGERNYFKRVYANPLEPTVCPILAVAVLIPNPPKCCF